jgi:hypothetical protein
MPEAQLCKVESTNEALDRSYRVVRSHIVFNPRRKKTGLVPTLAGLKCAIRHKQNRTSTLENDEFLPSLVGQITQFAVSPLSSPSCDLTNACALYHYHCARGYRAHRAPGIPCALDQEGGKLRANLGRIAPRDREAMSRDGHCDSLAPRNDGFRLGSSPFRYPAGPDARLVADLRWTTSEDHYLENMRKMFSPPAAA